VDAKELKTSAEQGAFALVEIVRRPKANSDGRQRAFGLDLEAQTSLQICATHNVDVNTCVASALALASLRGERRAIKHLGDPNGLENSEDYRSAGRHGN
jgi:hypothetical protein